MPKIQFERIKQESRFLNPLLDYSEDVHLVEHRRDPLTGTRSLVGYNLEGKVQMFFGATDQELLQKVARETQGNCFMCPEKVRSTTPKYPPALLPEGRITIGEATLFPNLFPLSEFHAVCALTHAHYLNLREFSPNILSDGIQACLEFIRRVYSAKKSARYMTINCNYLFPAGASAVHPHIQVLGGDVPYTVLIRMLDGSQHYFEQNHSSFWNDLIAMEKEIGERYIGRTGDVEWLASFAPLGTNEVQGILCEKHNFLEMSHADVQALGEGLSTVLGFYDENDYSTFNFTIYSGPLHESTEWFWSSVRIISRANIYENYRASEYFLQKLLGNEILLTSPEDLAKQLKGKF